MRITHSPFRRTWEPLPRSRRGHRGRRLRKTYLRSNIWLMKARESTRLSLNRMLREAKASKFWFWNRSLNIWLAPSKITNLWDSNHYLWGPSHWILRDPKDYKESGV